MDCELLAGIIRALEGRGVRVVAVLDGLASAAPKSAEGGAAEPDGDERTTARQAGRDGLSDV